MEATFEISLYPLDAGYEKIVTDFILDLRKNPGIRVVTNGLSTQIFGNYEEIFALLQKELKKVLEAYPSVFLIKMAKGELSPEKLPDSLK